MLTTSVLNFDSRCCLTEDEMICPEATKMLWSNETVTQIIILPRTESRVSSSQSVSQSLFYFSSLFFKSQRHFVNHTFTQIYLSFKHSGWVFLHEVVSCKKKKINTPRRRDVLSFLCVQTNLKISAESHFSIFTPFLGAAKWDTPSRTCCTVSSLWWVYVSRYILVFQHDSTYRP